MSTGDNDSSSSSPLFSVKHRKYPRHMSESLHMQLEDSVFDSDDKDYEDILIRNIQLWKTGYFEDRDSVFD